MKEIINKIGEGLIFIAVVLFILCLGFYLERTLEALLNLI